MLERASRFMANGLRKFSAALSIAMLCTLGHAGAEPAAPPNSIRKIAFSIPAQPLVTAMEAFGEITKAQIVYDTALVSGRKSPGIRGAHTPDEALKMLLAGTGLRGGYQGASTVFLVLDPAELPTAQSTAYMADQRQALALDTLRVEALPTPEFFFQSYALLVENGIKRALTFKDEPVKRPLRIKVWVDANGTIRQSALFVSSGDQQTDTYVLQRLQGFALQVPPPVGFPNPVFIRIRD
ncbi:MAG TPA: secretin and TonB N-terminal domain-containing protein [Rhizomicrobium sp.]